MDANGNVYVALSGEHHVAKYNPNGGTFQLDTSFDSDGIIGTSGTGNGQFNTPYDVAVSPDGIEIAVSDSGNHRIQRFSAANGAFLGTFGSSGTGVEQFNTPNGLTYAELGELYIVDSANNRVSLASDGELLDVRSRSGSDLGELQSPVNVSVNGRGIYLADAGNDRIQSFDVARSSYFVPLWATPSSLGLDQPAAVAAATGLVEEKVWIADTGNNRVLLVKVPSSNPESAWNSMKQEIAGDDLEGALAYFSSTSVNKYREAFTVIGLDELKPVVNQIPSLTPVRIGRDIAEYRFQQTVEGFTVTFTVKFVMENGIWRIQEY